MLSRDSVVAWLRDNGQAAAIEALRLTLSDAPEPAAAAAPEPQPEHSSSASDASALNGGIGEESLPSGFAEESAPTPSEARPDAQVVQPTCSPNLPEYILWAPPRSPPLDTAACEPRAA